MIYVHIGIHKTGSKSLQEMLSANREHLLAQGIRVYVGSHHNPKNHTELHLACLRPNRDSFAKSNFPEIKIDDAFKAAVAHRVSHFIQSGPETLVFSNEDLSWLRHPDEIDRLRKLLFSRRDKIRIVVYLREPASFLRSYEAQIYKRSGRTASDNPHSVFYVKPDSWLVDYCSLRHAYSGAFGDNNVIVFDYDKEVSMHGSIIPSFINLLGLSADTTIECGQFLNRTNPTV